MLGGFKLWRAFGVEVRVDWSLLVIFALVMFNLGAGLFPAWHPGWTALLSWSLAAAAAVLLIASVLAHELSHAVVARAFGIPVRRITLFLFGGLAHIESEPPSPKSEFFMAIVGPVASLVIGVGATVAAMGLGGAPLEAAIAAESGRAVTAAIGRLGPAATLLLWLGPVNVVLGVFNIVPGFPLDGGRVLRAALWAATGDMLRATRWAALGGQLFAGLLMALGVLNVVSGVGSGFWLLLVGWFLNSAARMAYREAAMRRTLEDVTVSGVMETRLDRVHPGLPVDRFVRDHVMASQQDTFPVEENGELQGVATLQDVRRVPQSQWGSVTVEQIMTPVAAFPALPPDAAAERALDQLVRRDHAQVLVVDGHHLLGLVRRRDFVRWRAVAAGRGGEA